MNPKGNPTVGSFAVSSGGFPGLVVRDKDPENLEFPFAALNGFITQNEHFFVRSHFPVPKLDTDT